MTEEIAEDRLLERLRDAYGLSAAALTRIPRGGDPSTIAYRVELGDGSSCFLEVKGGPFDEIAAGIALPRFLADLGLPQVVAPIPELTGRPSARLDRFHLVLFPFVSGRNAFETPLSEDQLIELGSVMKVVHSAAPSLELRWRLPVEAFAPAARIRARHHLGDAGSRRGGDPAAMEFAAFLDSRKAEIGRIVDRAEELAEVLRRRSPDLVICHGAIHAGNVRVADDGDIFLVGWGAPLLAPKERDLMFIGGGVGGAWNRKDEEAAFYLAYGPAEVDAAALAYYRYERIIGDFAATADALLVAEAGDDRRPVVERLLDQLGDGAAVAIADRTYDGLGAVAG